MAASPAQPLFSRQTTSTGSTTDTSGSGKSITGDSNTDQFLNLISSPFDSEFYSKSFLSAIIFSLALTALISLAFCFIRPYNTVVYAPRAKYADSKHAPPKVDIGLFGWVKTIIRTKEPELVEKVGLDAAVFMRFTRMMRNIFISLTVVGCAILIPLNLVGSANSGASFFSRFTPLYMFESPLAWAYVVVSYLFDGIIFYFLWSNYRAILRLRRQYFDSSEYQRSLHSRSLLLLDLPPALRTDDGIVRIAEEVRGSSEVPRAAIARNVRDLPDLVEQHEDAVKELEKVLAKYLKNPDRLPAKRPTTKVSKSDKKNPLGQEVDAIEYLTTRIKDLEVQIKEVRLSVDKRNAMSYGFATYEHITDAHNVAFIARNGGPQDTIVRLAPKPNDLIWNNLGMDKKARNWQNFINNLWVALLTVAWIAPNILIAVFLSNLSHLGLVWPAFQTSLEAHPNLWSLVQGIVAPAITTAFYYFLPAIFRRLVTKAGDVTRTGRERHVMHKLFAFFLFNNLIVFSLFSAVWGFAASLSNASGKGESTWTAIRENNPFSQIIKTLITVSPYWCSWLLQRNLGAAIDLSQLARLTWGSFSRRYLSPTPREQIELSAPQPFEYAAYYNYFIFYTAVALCFGALQPLALAITALYFWMDSFSKKYMILYIFITKYESGGMFWRSLFNRILVAAGLGNLVVACLVATQGSSWIAMLACMAPLAFLIGGFKWYCMKTFDPAIHFYNQGKALGDEALVAHGDHKKRGSDKISVRFGHPALYKPLMTPMVSAKAQHMLKQVYGGRTSVDESSRVAGYSDVYMDTMDAGKPGKSSGSDAPFEFVSDHQLDYEHWKDKPEFADEAGGEGTLFGRAPDMSRPGTPMSGFTGHTRTNTFDSDRSRSMSRDGRYRSDSDITRVNDIETPGVEYPKGYHQTPSALREQSPSGAWHTPTSSNGSNTYRVPRKNISRNVSRDGLIQNAATPGMSPPRLPAVNPGGGYGPIRGVPNVETPGETPEGEYYSMDYFRQPRGRGL